VNAVNLYYLDSRGSGCWRGGVDGSVFGDQVTFLTNWSDE